MRYDSFHDKNAEMLLDASLYWMKRGDERYARRMVELMEGELKRAHIDRLCQRAVFNVNRKKGVR